MSRLEQARQRAAGKQVDPSGRPFPAPVLASESALASYRSENVEGHESNVPQTVDLAPSSPGPAAGETERRSTDPHLDGKLVGTDSIDPAAVERYRDLAAALADIRKSRALKTVMIASAKRGEGRTTTAVNLALTLAQQTNCRVLLIDGDLQSPSIHTIFQLPNVAGLTQLLETTGAADEATGGRAPVVDVGAQLTVLTAGRPSADPTAALISPRMRALLLEAATRFEWVVMDAPCVASIEDPHLLAWLTDGAVLVVDARRTGATVVQDAIAALGSERVIGVVLNRC
jgi:capsular exopolysaccharide synthesis family protein